MVYPLLRRCEFRMTKTVGTIASYVLLFVSSLSFAIPSGNSLTMSLLTKEGHLSVKTCAFVPAVLNLPEIKRAPRSVSNVSLRSSHRGPGGGVDLTEGCMLTKSVKYTHQLSHLISAVRKGDPQPVVSRKFARTYPHLLTLLHIGGRHCEVVYRPLRQLHS